MLTPCSGGWRWTMGKHNSDYRPTACVGRSAVAKVLGHMPTGCVSAIWCKLLSSWGPQTPWSASTVPLVQSKLLHYMSLHACGAAGGWLLVPAWSCSWRLTSWWSRCMWAAHCCLTAHTLDTQVRHQPLARKTCASTGQRPLQHVAASKVCFMAALSTLGACVITTPHATPGCS